MPFLETPDWKGVVRNKHILFDADPVISVLEFNATNLLDELKNLGCTFIFIHPVLLELMNTDTPRKRLERSALLAKYEFVQIPITQAEIRLADRIQKSLPLKTKPSSTDYYLGGVLARYTDSSSALLLTSNAKDFPLPVYPRKAFINLQNDTDVKAVSILAVDMRKVLQ